MKDWTFIIFLDLLKRKEKKEKKNIEKDKQIYMFEMNEIFPKGRKSGESFWMRLNDMKNDNESKVLSIVNVVGSPILQLQTLNKQRQSILRCLYEHH